VIDFIPVAFPRTESELAVMESLLEANGIRHYVHNRWFGGLYPGLQIDLYNVRSVMVADDQAADACELLSMFAQPADEPEADRNLAFGDRLRIVFETLIFAWSFPQKRQKLPAHPEQENRQENP
jgi:hypothetical protein